MEISWNFVSPEKWEPCKWLYKGDSVVVNVLLTKGSERPKLFLGVNVT